MPAADYCSTPTAAGRLKRRYRSAAAARRIAVRMRGGAVPHLVGREYRADECPVCAGWQRGPKP